MKVICLDPGGTTGYCIGKIENGRLMYTPLQAEFDHYGLWEFLSGYNPEWIICESFEFRNRVRPGTELISAELIGVVRLYCQLTEIPLSLQNASTAGAGGKKGPFNNLILKDKGLYEAAKPHAMDASRHLLVWWMFGRGFEFNKTKTYLKV